MKTQTIEVEGLPEGWKAVAYRKPVFGEYYFYNDDIQQGKTGSGQFLIVEKIQPRRIAEIEENALNDAGWAVVSKYVEVVGEGIGGKLFNNLIPLFRKIQQFIKDK